MNNSLVSVIVPIYNSEKYITDCIKSIINQTYHNLEIILIDDGSTDSCPHIIDEFAKKDTRIKIIHQINMGQSLSRIKGIHLSKGNYIICIDSDDYIELNMIEILLSYAIDKNADIVISGYKLIENNNIFIKHNNIKSGLYKNEDLLYLKENLFYTGTFYESGIIPAVWNKLIKKDLYFKYIDKIPSDIRNGEDTALTYSIINNCDNIYIINEFAPYNYRIINNSITRTFDNKYFERTRILFNYLDSEFGCNFNGLKYYKLFMIQIGIHLLISNNLKKNKILKTNKFLKNQKLLYYFSDFSFKPKDKTLNKELFLLIKCIKTNSYNMYTFYYLSKVLLSKVKKIKLIF